MKAIMKSLTFKGMAIRLNPRSKAMLMLFFMFPVFLTAQVFNSLDNNLTVQVNGETVTLSQNLAERNCGAKYTMNVSLIGDTLYWYQVDEGSSAYCTCNFDLSVTVESMPEGHYIAKVFYTECPDCPAPGPNTVYVGAIEFDIVTPNSNSSISIKNQFQSGCLTSTSTKDDKVDKLPFSVFPNPVGNVLHLITNDSDEKEVTILDMKSNQLSGCKFSKGQVDIDMSSYKSGMYILVYSNKSTTYHFTFIKE